MLLQPPFEILPAPTGFIVQPALGDFDVFVRFVQDHHNMMVCSVSIFDQITCPDLFPARPFHPLPREVAESGVAAQDCPASAVGITDPIGAVAGRDIGGSIGRIGGIGVPKRPNGGADIFFRQIRGSGGDLLSGLVLRGHAGVGLIALHLHR